jgi:hypothetical protein
LVAAQILKNPKNSTSSDRPKDESSPSQPEKDPSAPDSEPPVTENVRVLWDIEDKEKLMNFVSKVFQSNFPTYVAYKQHIQMKTEEVSHQEVQGLGQFCEISEPDASPYLYRNVTLFCKVG